MCGIIGFTSTNIESTSILVDGLKALEYRGYDSCGIAIKYNDSIAMFKEKGKIVNLEKILNINETLCGIGHTRWATHGEPTKYNAHPHQVSNVTLVHNGIIENYDSLKRELLKDNIIFNSDTDTEVACAVIDKCINNTNNKLEAIKMACDIFEGSFAFVIMFNDDLDTLYCIKKDSPMIIGLSDNTSYVSSDISAFIKHTNKTIDVNENNIVVLKGPNIKVYDETLNEISYEIKTCTLKACDIQKDGYDTFLMKEIHEQPSVIFKTIHKYFQNDLTDILTTMPNIEKYQRFIFVGCGSAYHACMVGKNLMERKARIQCSVELASEFRYSNPIIDKSCAIIFVSQSGETADTIAALRMCNKLNIDTFGIVNVENSTLYNECKYPLLTLAGKEVSVATTKAYLAQVCVLSLLALNKAMTLNVLDNIEKKELEKELLELPKLLKEYLSNEVIESYANLIYSKEHIFFIGRGIDYALSLEGSLKLKEISYIHAEAYAAGELKHGTISLIEQDTPVIACITDEKLATKTISNIKETQARGSQVLWLVKEGLVDPCMDKDRTIVLPKIHSTMQAIISIIPYQLLAYYVAYKRGCDIDQPRNLAKSVTVE